jgi:predicted 3-demethylubiquinone-9 3-methyltransferase (glyoxalase superfamily)
MNHKIKKNIKMKRFHMHVRVKDLYESIVFYNALFGAKPTVVKPDYAKWMLDDPRINYAISTSEKDSVGFEHVGLQVENQEELHEVYANMKKAKGTVREEGNTVCCYAESEKSWIADPQGIEWEVFLTHGMASVYGVGTHARKAPEAMETWADSEAKNTETLIQMPEIKKETACCSPSK